MLWERWWWCKGERLWAFNKSRRQLIYPRRGLHVTDAEDALVAVRASSIKTGACATPLSCFAALSCFGSLGFVFHNDAPNLFPIFPRNISPSLHRASIRVGHVIHYKPIIDRPIHPATLVSQYGCAYIHVPSRRNLQAGLPRSPLHCSKSLSALLMSSNDQPGIQPLRNDPPVVQAPSPVNQLTVGPTLTSTQTAVQPTFTSSQLSTQPTSTSTQPTTQPTSTSTRSTVQPTLTNGQPSAQAQPLLANSQCQPLAPNFRFCFGDIATIGTSPPPSPQVAAHRYPYSSRRCTFHLLRRLGHPPHRPLLQVYPRQARCTTKTSAYHVSCSRPRAEFSM